MKCYHCGKTIPDSLDHCIYCHTKLKPDTAMLRNVFKDETVLTELYQMEYLRFYNHFYKCGIDQSELPHLTNTAFIHLLDHLDQVHDTESFEILLSGILDDESYHYMVTHPDTYDGSHRHDIYIKVNDEMISEMLDELDRTKRIESPITLEVKRKVGKSLGVVCLYVTLLISMGFFVK